MNIEAKDESIAADGTVKDKIEQDDDGDDMEETLEEYQELLEELGNHADKVTINLLTMVAEDHAATAKNASSLYSCIRDLLISPTIHPERKLPLVYLIDSILKNVKQQFIPLIEKDALNWIPVVYASLDQHQNTKPQKLKLKKVLQTWRDFQVFSNEAVQNMLACYEKAEADSTISKIDTAKNGTTAGEETSSALENVSGTLRIKMQNLLDEIHSDVDELEKVSLERLAAINPSLLEKIKNIAIEEINNVSDSANENATHFDYPHENSMFGSCIPKEYLKRAQDWTKITLTKKDAGDLAGKLQHHVMSGSKSSVSNPMTEKNTVNKPSLIAAASVSANHITLMLQFLEDNGTDTKNHNPQGEASSFLLPFLGSKILNSYTNITPDNVQGNMQLQQRSQSHNNSNSYIDKSLFTTEGVAMKIKNHTRLVGLLYDEGLPFLSTSDGRRFKTQIELSKHLDHLFRKSQLEKTMERTEERGWHCSSLQWSGIQSDAISDNMNNINPNINNSNGEMNDSNNAESTNVHADENRSRCVVCGNPFVMYFDQEEGAYMYKDCREIDLLNDEAAEEESEKVLVKIRCLQGLGSPEFLTMDQVLQNW